MGRELIASNGLVTIDLMEPVIYLVTFWVFKTGIATAGSMGVIPQASLEQCQANGEILKEFHKDYKEFRFICMEGVR